MKDGNKGIGLAEDIDVAYALSAYCAEAGIETEEQFHAHVDEAHLHPLLATLLKAAIVLPDRTRRDFDTETARVRPLLAAAVAAGTIEPRKP